MTNGIDILVKPGESPFDALKHIDPDGREYWMGRELMPRLGYEKWERFYDAVIRAQAACGNSGQEIGRNFRQVTELLGAGNLGQQRRVNFELSRYGAYLVAMNGDPRKPEIAAAQTYFATATRWAETAQREAPRELTRRELLQLAMEAEDAREEAETKAKEALEREGKALAFAAELQPKAEAFTQLMDADGTYGLAQAAQVLAMGRNQLIELLADYRMLIVRRGHSDHLRPYETARKDGRMALKVRTFEQEHRDGRKTMETDTTARITPKGIEYIRARRLREQQRTA